MNVMSRISGHNIFRNRGTPPPFEKVTMKLPKYRDKGRTQVNGKEPTSRAMKLVTARRNAEGRLLSSSHRA
jgi:hypothetical protein